MSHLRICAFAHTSVRNICAHSCARPSDEFSDTTGSRARVRWTACTQEKSSQTRPLCGKVDGWMTFAFRPRLRHLPPVWACRQASFPLVDVLLAVLFVPLLGAGCGSSSAIPESNPPDGSTDSGLDDSLPPDNPPDGSTDSSLDDSLPPKIPPDGSTGCSLDGGAPPNPTLVVLPDTQFYAAAYPEIFAAQTKWIANHRDSANLVAVLHKETWSITPAAQASGKSPRMPSPRSTE